jgi:hypothetical protein
VNESLFGRKDTQGIASLLPKPTSVDQPQLRVCLILSSDRFSSRDIPRRSQIDGAFGSLQARTSNPSCDRMAALQYIFPSTTGPIGKQGLNGFFNLHLFTSLPTTHAPLLGMGNKIFRAPGYLMSGTHFRPWACLVQKHLKMFKTSDGVERSSESSS